jgi:hypothetical protein
MQLQTKVVVVQSGGLTLRAPFTYVTLNAGVPFTLSSQRASPAAVDLLLITAWPANAFPAISPVETSTTPFVDQYPVYGTSRDYLLQSSGRADFTSASQPGANSVVFMFPDGTQISYSSPELADTQTPFSIASPDIYICFHRGPKSEE